MGNYRALVASLAPAGKTTLAVRSCTMDTLPEGEVLVRVHFSGLNYKDALSASGNTGVTRHYPHTPGIDAAGVVEHDASGQFAEGAKVIVSGYDLGMNTAGGFAEYIQVPATWVSPCPSRLTLRHAMALGTAGLTAAMCIDKLERMGAEPADKTRLLVSGASGGVGSLAVAMAAARGYQVLAMSGKASAQEYLYSLGAQEVIAASEWLSATPKALLKPRWHYAIDTLGGEALFNILKATYPEGALASCGMAAASEFCATVYPFILRGIALLGVDSAEQSIGYKTHLWQRMATDLHPPKLDKMLREVSLEQLPEAIHAMLAGRSQGRVLVNLQGS